jgi:hypothetical protein
MTSSIDGHDGGEDQSKKKEKNRKPGSMLSFLPGGLIIHDTYD